MEKVSVIIPCYNTEKYIGQCLESVIKQSYDDLEIIVVNDGSTDQSFSVMEEYRKKDARIVIVNQENQGLLRARRSGVEVARGEFIVFVDADDFLYEDEIKKAMEVQKKYKADLVKFRFRFVPEERDSILYFQTEDDSIFDKKNKMVYCQRFLLTDELNHIWSQLFRRSIYDCNFPIFESRINLGEDVLQNLFLISNAKKIVTTSFVGYAYRYNPDSITKKKSVAQITGNLNDLRVNIHYLLIKMKEWELSSFSHQLAYKMFHKLAEQIQALLLYTDISKEDFVLLMKQIREDEDVITLASMLNHFNVRKTKDIYINLFLKRKYDKMFNRKFLITFEKWIKKAIKK